jgi:peptide/nickel transport system ATP-binding protein
MMIQAPKLNGGLQVTIDSCQLWRERREILKDIRFNINPGETIGIIGESGAGKSTLFHAMLGYLPPSDWQIKGSVIYDSANLLAYSPKKWETLRGKTFRILLQEPAISVNPAFRIQYQLDQSYRLACPYLPKTQRRKNIVDLMQSLSLTPPEELLKRFPGELSGGQLQRVSIAMAIGPPCHYLFVDEPTNSLDSIISVDLINLLKKMRSSGYIRSLVFITHDLSIARALECNRILMLKGGRLIEDRTFKDLISAPKSKHARRMIATQEWLFGFGDQEKMRTTPKAEADAIGEIKNLSYSYPRKGIISKRGSDVLHGLSFKLRRGKFLGLVGNSGEGKTTIALSLALLFDEIRGEISVLNTNLKKLRQHKINRHFRHQIQLVTQNASTSFDPEQTILENSIECLKGRGVPIIEGLNAFRRLMRYFQISERCIKAYPHQLSSGEKQRLAIIRALSGDIRILVADEPFMHLDAANKERLVRLLLLLKRRRNNPLTVVLIMHDLYLARGLCDSILIIHGGKILEEDDPDVIFRSPRQEQTRRLVEASKFFGYT